ncbi:MAG: M23 family metallopeptidase [Bacteroidales bacterium]|jgi:hypothetical protein|nr:M23 family metallopeptidase [Bacteroidales bacterium]MCI1785679.1 M23 family metallopeptidase [Bacteroidales bacterium]
MRKLYVFDKNNFKFRKVTLSVRKVVLTFLKYFIATASLAVFFYFIFSFFFSTDTERELRRENRMYSKLYPEMVKKERLLNDVVSGLRVKDDKIYRDLFHTGAPVVDPIDSSDFISYEDSVPDKDIVAYSEKKVAVLERKAETVNENFLKIFSETKKKSYILPPLSLPLKNITYAQTGASIGQKINPFYKVMAQHNGIDLIAQQGEPVFAAGDGIVSSVIHSAKGLGNEVEINHGGGYVTRYAHLQNIDVVKGRTVKKGAEIGEVGMSGKSFAPHLHYEVLKDGKYRDPVDYFFASVTPDEYANMMYMSVSTGQSMD